MTVLSKWRVGVYLAAIFLAGAISGWMAATAVARQKAAAKPPQPHQIATTFKERVRALNLDPEQQVKVNAIAEHSGAELGLVNEENVRRVKQCFSNRYAQVCAILTPEQRKQFERAEREWRLHKEKNDKGDKGRRNWSTTDGSNSRTN